MLRKIGIALLAVFGLAGGLYALMGLHAIAFPRRCGFVCLGPVDYLLLFTLPGLAAVAISAFSIRALRTEAPGGNRLAVAALLLLSAYSISLGIEALLAAFDPKGRATPWAILFLPAGAVGVVLAIRLWRR